MAGWHHENANWKPKACAVCGAEFTPKSGVNKFCSVACRGKWKYITGDGSTENQYLRISGNWRKYYLRLLQRKGRKEDGLTVEYLLALHAAQQGKCALSSMDLTCDLSKGDVCYTNASIDRIEAGAAYSPGNVQLVCRHVNSWRGIMPVDVFVSVCRAVVATHDGVQNG
jgi:hypothetical protein